MVEILQKENPILRGTATEVDVADIPSPKIKKILRDMRAALESREDGIAIAAPQIGIPLRIFLVSPRAFEIEKQDQRGAFKETGEKKEALPPRVFINPLIIKTSKEKAWLEEGCLSVHNIYGRTRRSKKASVRALDEHGKVFTLVGNTLLSQIFQHEIDHLDGILFSDHAKDLHSVDDITDEK